MAIKISVKKGGRGQVRIDRNTFRMLAQLKAETGRSMGELVAIAVRELKVGK